MEPEQNVEVVREVGHDRVPGVDQRAGGRASDPHTVEHGASVCRVALLDPSDPTWAARPTARRLETACDHAVMTVVSVQAQVTDRLAHHEDRWGIDRYVVRAGLLDEVEKVMAASM